MVPEKYITNVSIRVKKKGLPPYKEIDNTYISALSPITSLLFSALH